MATESSESARPLLQVQDLRKYFATKREFPAFGESPPVRAVDGISFDVQKGETLGVVGESGCGKSTMARLLIRLIEPDEGTVILDGKEIGRNGELSVRDLRSQMQMVFQDSYASLNPRLPIEDSIAFGPISAGVPRSEANDRSIAILSKVGLDPRLFVHRYPHELSGGQRQRVNIARALALGPRLLILDEAVSALDKSVEAQVLNLLSDLKEQFDLTYIFISHDLNVVRYISDKVMVMYLGEIVEIGDVNQVYDDPRHPYTKALLMAQPAMDPDRRTKTAPITGDPPNPIRPPSGCRFHTRCPFAEAVCGDKTPPLLRTGDESRRVACHMWQESSGHSQAGTDVRLEDASYAG
ncbi:MAG: ATP-binding cassette domain-containing protein [Alphaproteobacteria bacterium]|nr:ATP-binding cassette domain-containing protein [Alphaproteobacteria bacterium]